MKSTSKESHNNKRFAMCVLFVYLSLTGKKKKRWFVFKGTCVYVRYSLYQRSVKHCVCVPGGHWKGRWSTLASLLLCPSRQIAGGVFDDEEGRSFLLSPLCLARKRLLPTSCSFFLFCSINRDKEAKALTGSRQENKSSGFTPLNGVYLAPALQIHSSASRR